MIDKLFSLASKHSTNSIDDDADADQQSTGYNIPEIVLTTSSTLISPSSSTLSPFDGGLTTMASSLALTTIKAIVTPIYVREQEQQLLEKGSTFNGEKNVASSHHLSSSSSRISFSAIFSIILLLSVLTIIGYYCFYRRWWQGYRSDRVKGLMTGRVDLKNVQILGQTYKEKVRKAIIDEMNMEEDEHNKRDDNEKRIFFTFALFLFVNLLNTPK